MKAWLTTQFRRQQEVERASLRPDKYRELKKVEATIEQLDGAAWLAATKRRAELRAWLDANPTPEVAALWAELHQRFNAAVRNTGLPLGVAQRICPTCIAIADAFAAARSLAYREIADIGAERAAIDKGIAKLAKSLPLAHAVFAKSFPTAPMPEAIRPITRRERIRRGLTKRTKKEVLAGEFAAEVGGK